MNNLDKIYLSSIVLGFVLGGFVIGLFIVMSEPIHISQWIEEWECVEWKKEMIPIFNVKCLCLEMYDFSGCTFKFDNYHGAVAYAETGYLYDINVYCEGYEIDIKVEEIETGCIKQKLVRRLNV